MKFVIHCLDRPGALSRRLENFEAHKAYLAQASVRVVISGPLLAPDQETMIGSLFVVEAGSQPEVERFNAEDPFRRAEVWAQVLIHPFNLRVDNRG